MSPSICFKSRASRSSARWSHACANLSSACLSSGRDTLATSLRDSAAYARYSATVFITGDDERKNDWPQSKQNLMPPTRRFPPPWSAEERPAAFVVCDHNGQPFAYVYFKEKPVGVWSYGSASPVSIVRAVGSAFLASICLSWSELHILHLHACRRLTSRGIPCRQDEWRQTTCAARSPRELCSARLGVPSNDPLDSVARRLPPRGRRSIPTSPLAPNDDGHNICPFD